MAGHGSVDRRGLGGGTLQPAGRPQPQPAAADSAETAGGKTTPRAPAGVPAATGDRRSARGPAGSTGIKPAARTGRSGGPGGLTATRTGGDHQSRHPAAPQWPTGAGSPADGVGVVSVVSPPGALQQHRRLGSVWRRRHHRTQHHPGTRHHRHLDPRPQPRRPGGLPGRRPAAGLATALASFSPRPVRWPELAQPQRRHCRLRHGRLRRQRPHHRRPPNPGSHPGMAE